MTYDLTKLEEKFQEFLKAYKYFGRDEIRITEDLFTRGESIFIPFGHMKYHLAIEDEKPVIFSHLRSRMDLNLVCLIDEDGWRCYDADCPEKNKDIWEKYQAHRMKVMESRAMKGRRKPENSPEDG